MKLSFLFSHASYAAQSSLCPAGLGQGWVFPLSTQA